MDSPLQEIFAVVNIRKQENITTSKETYSQIVRRVFRNLAAGFVIRFIEVFPKKETEYILALYLVFCDSIGNRTKT